MEIFTHTALNYNKTLTGVNVEEFGHSKTMPLRTFGPYWRDTYVLHFIVGGKGTFTRNHKPVRLKAGDCFIIVPNERTSYTPDELDPWEYYWVSFNGTDAAALIAMCGIDCSRPSMRYVPEDVTPLVKCINDYPYDYYVLGDSDELRILGAFMQTLSLIGRRNVGDVPQPTPHRNEIVNAAIQYMEANYYKGINITDISNALHVSRAHFTTVFSAEMGASPGRYFQKLRINKAKSLMADRPDLSVTEIAHAVGFRDVTRFCKVYGRFELQTPREHKKEINRYLSRPKRP